MRVSLNWLKEYVDIEIPAEELARKLSMAGILVEGIDYINDDVVMELELTPNRGDCSGMINVAREAAAVTGGRLHLPEARPVESGELVKDCIKVTIEAPDLCRRYAARVLRNVKIGPSPDWLQERLEKAGIRSINNAVDVTNYVMLETNQPLHAFDYDLLEGQEIIVRRPRDGETIVTLDEIERPLQPDMLVIADARKPVALAGIMGGNNSEVSEKTVNVLLESANFNGVNIRRTARTLGMRTEASMRFEKGVDPEGAVFAVDRAAALIQELCGAEVVSGVCDAYPVPAEPRQISLSPARVNWVLGTELSEELIEEYMKRLGFSVKRDQGNMVVTVPTYRPDLEIEEDLIEEVARLHGYDNIPSVLTENRPTLGSLNREQRFRDDLCRAAGRYLRQIVTYSFINPAWLDILRIPEGDRLRRTVALANPFSEEQGIMRTTLLPGLLDTVNRNLARRNDHLAFFEMGNIFLARTEGLPEERLMLGGIGTGRIEGWWQGSREMDYYYLKGIVEQIMRSLNTGDIQFEPYAGHPSYHPGRTARMVLGGKEIGVIGEIHPLVLERLDIKKRVWAFEIDVPKLYEMRRGKVQFQEFSRYPASERDLALVVDEGVTAASLMATIKEAGGELLQKVELFDVYWSPQIGEGKKSLAFSLTFQSHQGTLQDAEVNAMVEKIVEMTAARHGARLR